MGAIKEGDIVTRNSYGNDIFFKVIKLTEIDGQSCARLKGLDLRLEATAPLNDLKKVDQIQISQYWHKTQLQNMEKMKHIFVRRDEYRKHALGRATNSNSNDVESFDMPGTLVHLDGDREYLDMCMISYKQLSIECHGYHVDEEKQAEKVIDLLTEHRPDMLVLTGHDGLVKGAKEADYRDIKKYHNSQHFINAVRAARLYEKSLDDLIIFAGACQSHYEALLAAGANFASSPRRVLINAYDPVFVMEKVAYTSIYDPVPLKHVIASTITGFDGIGGVERHGAQSVKCG
ncbi:MAG: sporulation peptidase YabG [Bacillota bacterium]